jgi:hypothetical protein
MNLQNVSPVSTTTKNTDPPVLAAVRIQNGLTLRSLHFIGGLAPAQLASDGFRFHLYHQLIRAGYQATVLAEIQIAENQHIDV